MSARYMLAAYWPARNDSLEQCAHRLASFLQGVASQAPSLSTWYEQGKSRKDATLRQVHHDQIEQLRDLLNRGRNRRDVDGSTIDDLGYGLGLWNGAEEGQDARLRITCGLTWISTHPTASLMNSVVLNLPERLGPLANTETMSNVLIATAKAWEPQWAGVISKNAMRQRTFDARNPFVDWMIYVPKLIKHIAAPSSTIPIPGLGSMIVVQALPSTDQDQAYIQQVRKVEALIG